MNNLLILLPTLFVILPAYGQDAEIPEANWIMVEKYLEQQTDFSGTLMLGAGGKIRINHAYGYADREGHISFSAQSLYTIGSITKSFTATAILLLADLEKLSLQDSLPVYFEDVPQDKKDITIHQLLTHTSGFPGAIGDDYESISAEAFQVMAWKEPLQFKPGTTYEYSNVGYSLLGIIIEKISGQSYSAFLQSNIFIPAGMKTAGYRNPNADERMLAHGYLKDGSDWGTSHDKNWNGNEPYWHLKANGGLLMCSQDMYQWYLALRGNIILKPSLLTLQTTPFADEGEGSYYGYGYAVDQDGECVQHNGGNGIFKADFRWFPKTDIFLFSATNDANVKLFRMNDEIIRILQTGELPPKEAWEEIPGETFPSNENEYMLQAFIDFIKTYTPEKADLFIPEYCSNEMITRNGQEKLNRLFSMLHEDADPGSIPKIFSSGEKLQIVLQAREENAMLKITLSLEDHQIDRVGAEIEGM